MFLFSALVSIRAISGRQRACNEEEPVRNVEKIRALKEERHIARKRIRKRAIGNSRPFFNLRFLPSHFLAVRARNRSDSGDLCMCVFVCVGVCGCVGVRARLFLLDFFKTLSPAVLFFFHMPCFFYLYYGILINFLLFFFLRTQLDTMDKEGFDRD